MKFDFTTYMKNYDISKYNEKLKEIDEKLSKDTMSDWKDVSLCISKDELKSIKETSKDIRNRCDVLLVVGIGGSYLGAKMIISSLSKYFKKDECEVIFVGTSLSTEYLVQLKEYLSDKDVAINVISKSGSTLETKITFEYLIREVLEDKYKNYRDRVFVTTDPKESLLLDLALEKGYKTFTVPERIGGRYSVLSAVGLLPVAVAGFDVDKILLGATTASNNRDDAIKYALYRHELYLDKKYVESFTFYEEKYLELGEWLKQLFAETQGKEGKAILPITTLNTRDLHSLGQYFQEGERILFETVINVKGNNIINTSYNKYLNEVNDIAVDSVMQAHYEDGCYSNYIELEKMDEEVIGYLIYFFEIAACYGAYLLDVYPFDQPGVSKYKNIINRSLNN